MTPLLPHYLIRNRNIWGLKKIHALGKENHVIFDINYILSSTDIDGRV